LVINRSTFSGREAKVSTESNSTETIKDEIRSRILSGALPEGARVPSEHELAREFGLSRNYARQALSDLQAEGYLIRRQGSGSYVAPLADKLPVVDVHTRITVALVFPQQSRFMRNVTNGFMDSVASAGHDVITYNLCSPADGVTEAGNLRKVVESGISGLVAWIECDNTWTREVITELCERRFPLVLIDRYISDIDVDSVVSDNEEIGYQMTRALIQRGHRIIAFAGFSQTSPSSVRDRLSGYGRALQEFSLVQDEGLIVHWEHLRDTPDIAMREIMARCERPTAFVCTHDVPASKLHRELTALGYRVPENIELAMVDDEHNQDFDEIPSVKVAQNGHDLGRESAELLLARISDPDRPVERRLISPVQNDSKHEQLKSG
jgi:DNA-binding LacI/PurR family transcriptional regulator